MLFTDVMSCHREGSLPEVYPLFPSLLARLDIYNAVAVALTVTVTVEASFFCCCTSTEATRCTYCLGQCHVLQYGL